MIAEKEFAALIKMLNDVERSSGILERRGITFKPFVENYYDGSRLPCFHIRTVEDSEFFYDKDAYERRLAEFEPTASEFLPKRSTAPYHAGVR